MQVKWTFKDLILDGEDYVSNTDICIKHTFKIKDATLIVCGNFTTNCNIEVENGTIIVSGTLTVEDGHTINIAGGDISCGCLNCYNVNISGGDIWTNGNLTAKNIISTGNVVVGVNSFVSDVTCLNYLIGDSNDSSTIKATQNIFISGDNNSCELVAKEIFIDGVCNTNYHSITAQHFVCNGRLSC